MYAAERRYADPRNTPHLGGKGTKVPARNGIYADPPNNKLEGAGRKLLPQVRGLRMRSQEATVGKWLKSGRQRVSPSGLRISVI